MKRIALVLTALITLSMLSENQAQSTKVKMKTSMGDITIVLYDDTPGHRDNFIKLVNEKFYEGIIFHRVIPNFMIQGGDPTTRASKPGPQLGTIPAEFRPNRWHKKGALAAARTDNPQKASSGSQFYIVVGEKFTAAQLDQLEQTGRHPKFTEEQRKVYTTIGGTPHLDYTYTVYGEVTQGLDIVDKIALVPCTATKPVTDVKILSVQVVK
ncbi:MAG: peptidylprolyl isomerase [Bacteroidia bacterium]|nr:peptidylprolyl isomerase [Bacteroidia bacterium]